MPLRPQAVQLVVAGLLFVALAGFFFWRDLNLGLEFVLLPVALLLGATVVTRRPPGLSELGVWGLLLCAVVGGFWFAALAPPALLWGLGAAFVGTLAAIVRAPLGEAPAAVRARSWAWRAFAANFLAFSFALYFQFLTLGVAADLIARRLVLTGGWLIGGLMLLVIGQRRGRQEIAEAGSAVMIAALLKAAFYDTTHLGGPLRISAMLLTGVLLFGGAALLPHREQEGGRDA